MGIFNEYQQDLAETLSDNTSKSDWTNWKWHIRHAVKSVDDFERALGIAFSPSEKLVYQQTLDKFPMSVTPYYLSLIDAENYATDPIFMVLPTFPWVGDRLWSAPEGDHERHGPVFSDSGTD